MKLEQYWFSYSRAAAPRAPCWEENLQDEENIIFFATCNKEKKEWESGWRRDGNFR